MIGLYIAGTCALQVLGYIGLVVGFWLLVDCGTRPPSRLPQHRATAERVAELRRRGHE